MVLAVVFTAVGALMMGILIGRRVATVAPPPSPEGATVADLDERVVLSSHNGVVLLNSWGGVVLANPPAGELGLVHGGPPDERAAKAAERVRKTGEVVHVDLSPLNHLHPADPRPSGQSAIPAMRPIDTRVRGRNVMIGLLVRYRERAGLPRGGQMAHGRFWKTIPTDSGTGCTEELIRGGWLRTPAWQEAFRDLPRHVFLPRFFRLTPSHRMDSGRGHRPTAPALFDDAMNCSACRRSKTIGNALHSILLSRDEELRDFSTRIRSTDRPCDSRSVEQRDSSGYRG